MKDTIGISIVVVQEIISRYWELILLVFAVLFLFFALDVTVYPDNPDIINSP